MAKPKVKARALIDYDKFSRLQLLDKKNRELSEEIRILKLELSHSRGSRKSEEKLHKSNSASPEASRKLEAESTSSKLLQQLGSGANWSKSAPAVHNNVGTAPVNESGAGGVQSQSGAQNNVGPAPSSVGLTSDQSESQDSTQLHTSGPVASGQLHNSLAAETDKTAVWHLY